SGGRAACAHASCGASLRQRSSCSHPQNVDRTLTGAELDEPLCDGASSRAGGAAGGVLERLAAGEQRRQRGRVRAARAVRGGDRVTLDRDLDVRRAVEEVVDSVLAVTAGDDDRGRAELVQPLGELCARAAAAGERL